MRLSLAALLVLLGWSASCRAEERGDGAGTGVGVDLGALSALSAENRSQNRSDALTEPSAPSTRLSEETEKSSRGGDRESSPLGMAESVTSHIQEELASEESDDGFAAYESVLQEMLRVVAMEEEEEHQREAAMVAEEQTHVEYEPPFDFRPPREELGLGKQQHHEAEGSFGKAKGSTLRSARANSVPLEDPGLRNNSRGRVPGERRQSGGSYFGESRQASSVSSSEIRAMEDLGRSFGIDLDLAAKEERRRKAIAEQERARRRDEERIVRMRVRRRYASPVEDILRHVDLENPSAVFDPYKVLGVSKHASHSDIKRVFRSRVVAVHPDKNPHPVITLTRLFNESKFPRMRKWHLMLFTMHWRYF